MRRILALALILVMSISSFAFVLATENDILAPQPGVHIVADDTSPTGFFVTFVHYNREATLVELGGDMMLRDIYNLDNTEQYYPHEFRPGLFPTGGGGGGRNFREPMEYIGDGLWTITVPLTGGAIAYWYFVTIDDETIRIGDPMNPPPFSPSDVRSVINDELSAVRIPWDSLKQHELNNRYLELLFDGPRGAVQYVRFDSSYPTGESQFLRMTPGEMFGYMMVYLPPNFDPNRSTPYPVVYMSHGVFGDQTDWMGAGGVPHIMDNLIGAGIIEPTVVVSINNSRHADGPGFAGALFLNDNALSDFINYVIPFAEANFNVSGNSEERAIAGLSLGAVFAAQVYYHYTAEFSYFGFFSPPNGPTENNIGIFDLTSLQNRNVPELFYGYGVFAAADYVNLPNIFDEAGISFASYAVPGHHDMNTWAQLFVIFARDYLWQSEQGLVPLRAIAEARGAQVEWIDETRTVAINIDDRIVSFAVDEPLPGDFGMAELINDRTFVPNGFIEMIFE